MDDLITAHEPIEDCDCHACAIEFRNRYRAALAGVSEEIGLPPTMGPSKGDLKRLLDQARNAIDKLRDAPVAISSEADFDSLTWTFRVPPDCQIGAGKYALVWMGPNVAHNRPASAGPG